MMKNYKPGEILLVDFPFTDSGGFKRRPALVIIDTNDADVIIARITTQKQNTRWDSPIVQWQGAQLIAPSWVRVHKLLTLEKQLVEKRIGFLHDTDLAAQIFRTLI